MFYVRKCVQAYFGCCYVMYFTYLFVFNLEYVFFGSFFMDKLDAFLEIIIKKYEYIDDVAAGINVRVDRCSYYVETYCVLIKCEPQLSSPLGFVLLETVVLIICSLKWEKQTYK